MNKEMSNQDKIIVKFLGLEWGTCNNIDESDLKLGYILYEGFVPNNIVTKFVGSLDSPNQHDLKFNWNEEPSIELIRRDYIKTTDPEREFDSYSLTSLVIFKFSFVTNTKTMPIIELSRIT